MILLFINLIICFVLVSIQRIANPINFVRKLFHIHLINAKTIISNYQFGLVFDKTFISFDILFLTLIILKKQTLKFDTFFT